MESCLSIFIIKEHIYNSRTHTPLIKATIEEFRWTKKSMSFTTACLAIHKDGAIEAILERVDKRLHD
jgi:hypothetical protein